jgi:RNA polymerase sigma factor (sigma-70 family)
MRTEDGSIIHRCLNGEPEAFGILVDKYKEGIYAFAHTKLRDFRDAQDVTQEVFVRAYRDLHSLRRWESFAFWLYRIASARCKLWIRTQSRRVDQDFIEDQDPEMLEAESMSAYRYDRVSESLQESMDSLPETYREVLMLHYFGGMTIKDIARAIGISPGAVGMRLSRARAQLKEEMIAMMDTAFEGQRLPAGFTFRIVEAVKRIKINPMPRTAGLPWGLSLAAGVIITVLSLSPYMNISRHIAPPTGLPLSAETKVLKAGEIAVDIMKTSEISVISSKQGDGDNGSPGPQNTFFMAPNAGEGTWARKADMLGASSGLSTGVVDGIIYAIGGTLHWPGGPYLSTVVAYDPAKDAWTEKANMPTGRRGLSTSVVDGIIYAIGGATGHRVVVDLFSTVEAYDPAKDTWTKKAGMPTARTCLSTSVVDGIIYAIGGSGGDCGLGDSIVEAYDPAADTWTTKADMPTRRYWLTTSVVNGIIYAIGGWIDGEDGERVSAVEAYDPAMDTWTKKADMPNGGRAALSARTVNGYIYAIGGWDVAATDTVEKFDPGSIAVKPTGKLPTKWGEVKSD